MRCLSLSALCLLVSSVHCYVPSDWTACSKECGSGQRSANTFTITCHNIGCNFKPSCSYGGNTDLVFVMDESGSIGHKNYWVQKQFAVDIIYGLFRVDPTAAFTTRVGLVAFASRARTVFDLNAGYKGSDAGTVTAIWETTYKSGGTRTWHGLNMANDMLKAQGRADRKQVVIVMTDGKSSSKFTTVAAATALKDTGATVYGIGIGNVNQAEMHGIASVPTSEFYYYVNNYSGLVNIIEDVLNGTLCDTVPPECTTAAPNTACSVTCGGGTRTVQKTCKYYNLQREVIRTEVVTITEECCTGACGFKPDKEDCRNCPLQNNVGYLQDPTNCHCFFMCQLIDGEDYLLSPQMCCSGALFWRPSIKACDRTQESGCGGSSGGGSGNPGDVCPSGVAPTTAPTAAPPPPAACPYQTNPANPQQFLLNGQPFRTCPTGHVWDDNAAVCACVGAPETCTSAYLLHYDFEGTLNDVSCTKAMSENHGVLLVPGHGIGGSSAAYFNGQSFLGVPYMNNHFAGQTVTGWTISLWYRRTGGSGLAGLLGNGDCEEEPSLALLINAQNQLEGRLITSATAYSQSYVADPSINNGQWKHVVLTYDGQTLTLYNNNGNQHHSMQIPATGGIANRQCNLKIGHKNGDATTGFFRGYMDEIRIYERALTSSEVTKHYYTESRR